MKATIALLIPQSGVSQNTLRGGSILIEKQIVKLTLTTNFENWVILGDFLQEIEIVVAPKLQNQKRKNQSQTGPIPNKLDTRIMKTCHNYGYFPQ